MDLSLPLKLLEQGARQVLALVAPEPKVERMLIYVEPSSSGRDAALAAAASLSRHLTIDVAMPIRDEERSSAVPGATYRDVLDLRSASLRQHGLDIRTETFRGKPLEAVRERLLTSEEQTLLVIGLTSPEGCSTLLEDLRELLKTNPPAA